MTDQPGRPAQPLAAVRSIKVKLGLLVAASATVAALVAALGRSAGVPAWLTIPVTIALALALTQLLAVGMTSPLRQMTAAARRMATGDYAVRVADASRDEVGELARAFNTMARDLADVDRQRRELVANVSHELRTPLAGLRAVLENVVDGVVPDDPATLATALAQAERMSGLVEDLLDLARVDAGRAPLAPRPVPLADLLDRAVAEAEVLVGITGGPSGVPRPGHAPRGVADARDTTPVSPRDGALRGTHPEHGPPSTDLRRHPLSREVTYAVRVTPPDLTVTADPARLHQLVANLLDNASRHSPAGGVVDVTAERYGDRYRLEVRDHGPGIPAAARERVFEAFGTLRAGGEETGGTGLGLAIARWVTDLHGGTIGLLDPPPGSTGARIRVDLPLEPAARPAVVPSSTPAIQESPMPTPTPTAPAPPAAPAPVTDDLFGSLWPERGLLPRVGLLLGALGAGVLGGVVLPERALGVGTFAVLLACGAVVLVASPRRREPFTLACAGLCVLLAAMSVVRDAEWIVVLCLLAGAALCIIGATGTRTLGGFVLAGLAWPLAGLRGLPWLGRTLGALPVVGHGAALLRTVIWSVLGLVVFGALFVSADALVAEWVDALLPDLTMDTFVLRAFLSLAVGGTVLAAAYLSLNPPRLDRELSVGREVARRYEWLVPVLVVVGVFAVFLIAQATVVFGGHGYLRRTTGLTYAEYVHQGFAQLTVATALTLLVVGVAARKAPRATAADRAWLRAALGALCLETLIVVASALYRMDVYQEAYGFTGLRLLVDVFEGWLGLLVLAVLVGGIRLRAAWLPRFAVLSGAIGLLGLALVNPDAWSARHNLERYAETGRVDWAYLRGLSDDAVPVLAELTGTDRQCALAGRELPDDDWLEWNLGRSRALDVLTGDVAAGDSVQLPNSSGNRLCGDESGS